MLHGRRETIAARPAIPSNDGGAVLPELMRWRHLAAQYALDDGNDCFVPSGGLRNAFRLSVHGGYVAEQVAHIPFAEDVKVGQRKQQRFADAEGGQPFDIDRADLAGRAFHATGSLSRHDVCKADPGWLG